MGFGKDFFQSASYFQDPTMLRHITMIFIVEIPHRTAVHFMQPCISPRMLIHALLTTALPLPLLRLTGSQPTTGGILLLAYWTAQLTSALTRRTAPRQVSESQRHLGSSLEVCVVGKETWVGRWTSPPPSLSSSQQNPKLKGLTIRVAVREGKYFHQVFRVDWILGLLCGKYI